jgi:plastocyanin
VRRQTVIEFFGSPLLLGIVLFIFSVGFPPFDDLTTIDLTAHMVEHVMIVIAGVLIGLYCYKRGLFSALKNSHSRLPSLGLLGVVALVAFWHLPDSWDAAVLDPTIHAIEHLSFLLVGFMIGSLLQRLSDYSKINALVLAFLGHMGYGIVLISPLNIRVYPLYSLGQQSSLALAILAPGPAYWAGIVYILSRNRSWLQEEKREARSAPDVVAPERRGGGARVRYKRAAALSLSVVMIVVLVGYYGMTAAAIGLPSSPSGSPTVYIIETPVSWQFSPQQMTVVLGVNSTVTWISRSISYDTVTGSNGSAFSSGSIAPGQKFTYSFTQPGRYVYKCIYHPWMTGVVIVLPHGSG